MTMQPFNPQDAVNKIRDKIRGSLADLIPDEQWNTLIAAEVKLFMEDRPDNSYYQPKIIPSGFKQAIREVLAEDCKKRVSEMLKTPEWVGQWSIGGKPIAGEALGELLKKYGAEIMRAYLADAVAGVLANIANR